jgi:hypothetical protein
VIPYGFAPSSTRRPASVIRSRVTSSGFDLSAIVRSGFALTSWARTSIAFGFRVAAPHARGFARTIRPTGSVVTALTETVAAAVTGKQRPASG